MRVEYGNIWDYHKENFVVVPTNLGFTKDGRNVMGAGVARQAAEKFPGIDLWYGEFCRDVINHEDPELVWNAEHRLIFLPVKPLDRERPWLSWRQNASLSLVERSVTKLANRTPFGLRVALPVVGCGNGKLPEDLVLPILAGRLNDKFTLVRYE